MIEAPILSEDQKDLLTYIPPAVEQTEVPANELLNSSNCGVIIMRRGQLKNYFRNVGREFAIEVCNHTNKNMKGMISSYIYEETFAQQDCIYWFIHLRSFSDYMRFHRLAKLDPAFGEIFMRDRAPELEGGADWGSMFPDGTFEETVLFPHYWGYDGTVSENATPPKDQRQAKDQTEQAHEEQWHSGNSRVVLMRSGQLKTEFRSEGRVFARAYADYINRSLAGLVTCYTFEEHFGDFDRIHWHINMEKYEDFEVFTQFIAEDSGYKELLTKDWADGRTDSGNWSGLFQEGGIKEILVCPQHPTKDY